MTHFFAYGVRSTDSLAINELGRRIGVIKCSCGVEVTMELSRYGVDKSFDALVESQLREYAKEHVLERT